MIELLKELVASSNEWVEFRYHKRIHTEIAIQNGELSKANLKTLAGVGIRVLVDGSWGFFSTSNLSKEGLAQALEESIKAARMGAKFRKNKIEHLAIGDIAKGSYHYLPDLKDPDLKEKITTLLEMDKAIREDSELVVASGVGHNKLDDYKIIVNSDGAEAEIFDVKQDVGVECTVSKDGKREKGSAGVSITGSWFDLFKKYSEKELVAEACRIAKEKLDAEYVKGGQYTVILDPQLVGVLAHEAIGHTVEADFVLAGSIAAGKIGQKVASELITLIDEGNVPKSAGMVIVDDEGIISSPSIVIDKGILTDYLHNRESAYLFNTSPKGNGRAFTYQDEPLIRMTNTYFQPGEDDLDDMIAGINEGYLLTGFFGGGQADSTAEFMFGVMEGQEIKDGRLGKKVKGLTISGQAFEVLQSVDAVSKHFELGIGRGYCGKWQPAKTDAGGPYIRCQITIGGQS